MTRKPDQVSLPVTIAVYTSLALYVWFMITYGTPRYAMTVLVGTLCFLGFITFAIPIDVLSSKRGLRAVDVIIYTLLITLYIVLSTIMVYKIQVSTTAQLITQMGVLLLMVFSIVGVMVASLLYGLST